MGRFDYTENEKRINKVLLRQEKELSSIESINEQSLDDSISASEKLLLSLGYSVEDAKKSLKSEVPKTIIVPSWEELCAEVEQEISNDVELEDLFTQDEIKANSEAVAAINEQFKQIHRLDKYDYIISAIAAILAGAVDILLVGIPHSELRGGEVHKPLSDLIRKHFEEKYPPGALENTKRAKTSYDAQDNRNTSVEVVGLSSYYHRLLSVGHDPLLGFVVGVLDIMNGSMTTIDKKGKIVTQVIEAYADRKESNVFAAIAKQVIHLKSDITTSMGLPAPLMGLFNLLQIPVGDPDIDRTIASIVQEMYHEGYDFIHFCSMSIPVMVAEVVVRLCYYFRRFKETGSNHNVMMHISMTVDRQINPKLGTMLFIAHTGAAAVNAGKVHFSGNDPMAINYVQWAAFAMYSFKQLKWVLMEKPELQDAFVRSNLQLDLQRLSIELEKTMNSFSGDYVFVMSKSSLL